MILPSNITPGRTGGKENAHPSGWAFLLVAALEAGQAPSRVRAKRRNAAGLVVLGHLRAVVNACNYMRNCLFVFGSPRASASPKFSQERVLTARPVRWTMAQVSSGGPSGRALRSFGRHWCVRKREGQPGGGVRRIAPPASGARANSVDSQAKL